MTTAEHASKALWRRGNLSWKLHAGQIRIKEALHKSKGKLFVGNCARQLGKSFEMVSECIEVAIKVPKARIKYGTAFLADLVEFIQPNFETILEDCPNSLEPIYKSQKTKWVFTNGSEIKLVGLDKNPDGMRGNAIDLSVLDECGFVSDLDYLYKSVLVPATTHRPNAKIILISTPPSTPAHSFVDYAQRAEAEGNYIKLSIYDNPMITPERIAELMRESGGEKSTTWRREYLCEFVTDEDSKIIPEWKPEYVKETPEDEFYKFYHRYEGMDLGVKHFTVVIFGYYDFKRATLVIQDEIKLNGPSLTTKILAGQVEGTETRLWPDHKPYRRISDNNNLQLIQDMAIDYKMNFIPTNKEALEAMVNELRIMVGKGQIEIHPRCKQLIGCLEYGVWDKQRKKFAESKTYGHFDALAALIYLVRNLDKHCNPIPHDYGFDPRRAVIKTQKHNSEGAKLLRGIMKTPTRKPTY